MISCYWRRTEQHRLNNPIRLNTKRSSKKTFDAYPDDWADLRAQGLIFVRNKPTLQGTKQEYQSKEPGHITTSLLRLIGLVLIEYEPITYEDFLSFSAAGIF